MRLADSLRTSAQCERVRSTAPHEGNAVREPRKTRTTHNCVGTPCAASPEGSAAHTEVEFTHHYGCRYSAAIERHWAVPRRGTKPRSMRSIPMMRSWSIHNQA